MNTKIKNFRKFEKNTLRGFCDLEIGDFTVKDWTYHTKNGKSWVNPPAKQYTDDNGERKYSPIVFIEDRDRYQAFQKWAVGECAKLFSSLPQEELNEPF